MPDLMDLICDKTIGFVNEMRVVDDTGLVVHEQDFSRHCEERQQAGLKERSFKVSALPTERLP